MNKQDFILKYSIANAEPLSPTRRFLPAESFSIAISEFLNNRFEGLVRVQYDNITAQSILICAEYVAFFFKTLLTDIYGRAILNIEIASDEKNLTISILCDGGFPLSESELRRLIRIGRNGGFEIYPDTDSITLSTELVATLSHRVYAVSIADGRRIMFGKMVEIFCHGELLSIKPLTPRQMPKPIEKKTRKNKNSEAPRK